MDEEALTAIARERGPFWVESNQDEVQPDYHPGVFLAQVQWDRNISRPKHTKHGVTGYVEI